jgi:hypothetical protein
MVALTKAEREVKLDALEAKFKSYVKEQRQRLEYERDFLKLILDKQGLQSAARRNANTDKLAALATVKELLPTSVVGSG